MFFLSLETSTVAFRTVLDELFCFFLALNLTSFQYFCQESFFFAFLFAFQRKFAPKIPAKIPRNRPFSPRICLFKSREISLFFPRIIRSPVSLLALVSLYTCSSYLTGICYFSVVCFWSLTLTSCFTHTIHFSLSKKQIFLSSGKCKAFKCKAHYDFASSCDISQTQRILVLLSSSTDVTKFYSCWKGNIVSNSFCHS